MNCCCVSTINGVLREMTGIPDVTISGVGFDFRSGESSMIIKTEIPFSKKKTPPVVASFCPFCGVRIKKIESGEIPV